MTETKGQVGYQLNREKEAEDAKKIEEKKKLEAQKAAAGKAEATRFMESGEESFGGSEERDQEFNLVPDKEPSQTKKYNSMDIPNTALASMRHHTGLRETAEIATAALIDAGVVTDKDTRLVIDHNKVKRAQEKLAKEFDKEFDDKIRKDGVSCLFFDGRQDDTRVMLTCEDSDKQFPGLIKEEHYSVCQEPGGKYLFHFTPGEASKEKKHSELIADEIVTWLKDKGADKTLQAIGGDSTSVNTGWCGGAMHWVEVKLGRKLVWIVCDLHTGELPLRKLITEVDGKTLSNNKWSGDLGKMLDTVTELEIDPNFAKVDVGPPIIELRQEVVKELSTDQSYAYQIYWAIRTGKLSKVLAHLEIGPVSHSRWLTTACRMCRLWISKHGLSKKNVQKLRLIIEFIIGVYFPNWFNIKVKHSWVDGPQHVLYQLQCIRSQKKKVVEIVMETVQRGAWYAHCEAVLQAMLCSHVREERNFAVEKICEIRGEGDEDEQCGVMNVRDRKTPVINMKSKILKDLIDWSEGITEPSLTCSLTTKDIRKFVDIPMEVPNWSSHTQSVERIVKKVTEAAAHVYSHERRDGYVRSHEVSAELMARNRSKQDLVNLVKFRRPGE